MQLISYSLSESVGEKRKVGRMEESKEEREGERKRGEQKIKKEVKGKQKLYYNPKRSF